MRHILQGFTMYLNGADYGIDTEEVELPFPKPKYQEYQGGGMDMSVNLPMMSIEAMEVTFKLSGQNPTVMGQIAQAPGRTQIVTFRGGVLTERDGSIVPHICIVEGCVNASSRDKWHRGEKVGFDYVVNGIRYLRYEANAAVIHELQAWPPKRIINGVDQLEGLNAALGY